MKGTIILIFSLLFLSNCAQKTIKTQKETMTKFSQFREKEKFIEDKSIFYPGIGDPKMRPILTEKINKVADGFEAISKSQNLTEESYQNVIRKGLSNFADVYLVLDTEDRERVCHYFEEIMDIVDLESSNGQLNDFMYGFDPTENK